MFGTSALWEGVHAVQGVYECVCRHSAGVPLALRSGSRFLLQPGLFSAVFEAGLSLYNCPGVLLLLFITLDIWNEPHAFIEQ